MSKERWVSAEVKRQHAINQKVFRAIKREGDNLRGRREVRHWSYFTTAADRRRFLGLIRSRGFVVVTQHKSPGDRPYCICYDRTEERLGHLDEVCAVLTELSEGCAGEYDGWETQVETVQ